ncbi:hypothetical protein FRC12_001925 [Ceratobasidium sp. 428]|nr:hypothetical protein FRC12_001925 [Ceratobasidium sp. 428]
MGGPGKTKVDSAVPDSSASMVMGDPRSLRREPEPSSAQPPVPDSSYTFEDGNVTVQYPPPAPLGHQPYGHYPAYPQYGYGPPSYNYPPPPPAGYSGYGVAPQVTGHMLLSEWLVMCDRGPRGEHEDNFSGLIAGFSARRLFYLFEVQNKPADFFYPN